MTGAQMRSLQVVEGQKAETQQVVEGQKAETPKEETPKEYKMKVCGKCGVSKAVSEFYKRTDAKDGLNRYCKECVLKRNEPAKDEPVKPALVKLDFAGFEDVYEKLSKRAAEETRTLEYQIYYYLRNAA